MHDSRGASHASFVVWVNIYLLPSSHWGIDISLLHLCTANTADGNSSLGFNDVFITGTTLAAEGVSVMCSSQEGHLRLKFSSSWVLKGSPDNHH